MSWRVGAPTTHPTPLRANNNTNRTLERKHFCSSSSPHSACCSCGSLNRHGNESINKGCGSIFNDPLAPLAPNWLSCPPLRVFFSHPQNLGFALIEILVYAPLHLPPLLLPRLLFARIRRACTWLPVFEWVWDRQKDRQAEREMWDQSPLSIFGRDSDVGREKGGVMMRYRDAVKMILKGIWLDKLPLHTHSQRFHSDKRPLCTALIIQKTVFFNPVFTASHTKKETCCLTV